MSSLNKLLLIFSSENNSKEAPVSLFAIAYKIWAGSIKEFWYSLAIFWASRIIPWVESVKLSNINKPYNLYINILIMFSKKSNKINLFFIILNNNYQEFLFSQAQAVWIQPLEICESTIFEFLFQNV